MAPAHIMFIACYSYILFSICYRTGNDNPNKSKKNYTTNSLNTNAYQENLPFTLKSILKMCLLATNRYKIESNFSDGKDSIWNLI